MTANQDGDEVTEVAGTPSDTSTAAGSCEDATEIVPAPTEAALELAWSKDQEDYQVWDYPTMLPGSGKLRVGLWWGKVRQRVTDFFHPFPDEAGVAAMDDYDDTMDDDADDDDDDVEPIEITDASWRAAFAAASPIVFVAAAAAFLIVAAIAWAYLRREAAPAPAAPTTPVQNWTPEPSELPSAAPAPTTVTITPSPPATITVTETPQAAPPAPAPAAPKAAAPNADMVFRRLVLQIPEMHVVDWEITEAGAHRVCGYMRQGHSHDDATQQVLANDPTFTPWQASAMVNASATAYCPQYGG